MMLLMTIAIENNNINAFKMKNIFATIIKKTPLLATAILKNSNKNQKPKKSFSIKG